VLACVLAGFLVGFGWAGTRASWRMADALDPALEGVPLLVTGIVDAMPQTSELGVQWRFAVESAERADPREPVRLPPVLWLGWYANAQLSVVNVVTFTNALVSGFHWEFFLAAPLVFILWAAVAAALAPITFGTVQHMLFDNARLVAGETVLVHAGGSGIGSAAIQLAKAAGATVITTVGSDDKIEKARALGADHVINYTKERFEGRVRKLTARKGVDVVFEHVGAKTWAGSMLSMKRGGRLVTCGSTTGITAETNLHMLFQQQLRLIGSFGCNLRNMAESMEKMASGAARPVIDTMLGLDELETGLKRLEDRQVFGKIVVRL
jgi:threonine dehydrogenase-like Zn-dependent dehydrogenase